MVKLKVALVHEFLTQLGGAEKVLLELTKIFPGATIYTLIYDRRKTGSVFGKFDIRTSFLQKLPGAVKHYKKLVPLLPWATERLKLDEYDLIFSDSSAFIKGVNTNPKQIHICYCHTPTRYLWTEKNYVQQNVPLILRPLLKLFIPYLKRWDWQAAQKPEYILGNSKEVQNRIKRIYQRLDAGCLYPSVETEKFTPAEPSLSSSGKPTGKPKRNYYLMTGRLVYYKRFDIAVKAFNEMADKRLIIAGAGPEKRKLETLATSPNIKFLGQVGEKKLISLYQNAKGYIFTPLEDFGIAPLEAMSCATPVIAYGKGGALETVIDGRSGIFFPSQTVKSLKRAVARFEKIKFSKTGVRRASLRFSQKRFRMEVEKIVKTAAKTRLTNIQPIKLELPTTYVNSNFLG